MMNNPIVQVNMSSLIIARRYLVDDLLSQTLNSAEVDSDLEVESLKMKANISKNAKNQKLSATSVAKI